MTGHRHEPRHDRGECAFHARDRDDGVGAAQHVLVREEAVDARDTHIVEAGDAVAHDLGRDRGLLGDRNASAVPPVTTTM
jgi:hypothetical protein